MSVEITEELIKTIMSGDYKSPDVEELLYADRDETSDTLATVQEGTVPDGYEGMIVGVAVSKETNQRITLYLKRDGKQYYENGLRCAGLSKILDTGVAVDSGVDGEVFLGIRIKEKGKWELGFKSSAGTPNVCWRLRVRHFKKGS
jgi:hypothetical protein